MAAGGAGGGGTGGGSGRRVSVVAEFRARVGAMLAPLRLVLNLTGRLLGNLTSIKSLLGGAAFAMAARSAAGVNAAFEATSLSMATNFESAARGALTFQQATQLASANLAVMKKQAADLPGTFDEMSGAFNTMLPALTRFGVSIGEVRDLAAMAVVSSKTQGVETWKIASDVAQIMAGSATERAVQTFSLKPMVKELNELLKAGKSTEALAKISETLRPSQQALAAYATTWDSAFSTAVGSAQELWRIGTQPLFEAAKAQVLQLNAWFEANKAEVIATAKAWGVGVVKGLRSAWQILSEDIYPRLVQMKELVVEQANWFRVIAEVWVGTHLLNALVAVVSRIKAAIAAAGLLKVAMMGVAGVIGAALGLALAGALKQMHDIRDTLNSVEQIDKRIRARKDDTRAEFAKLAKDPAFKAWAESRAVSGMGDPASEARHSRVRQIRNDAAQMDRAGQPMLARMLREQANELSNARGVVAATLATGDFAAQSALLREWKKQQGKPAEPVIDDFRFGTGDKDDKPKVNVKIDNVFLTMNIDEGDPDRIALALPSILMQPILAPAGG